MSISGSSGHPEYVVIDGAGPSFASQSNTPATVRIGLTHETVEWLTVIGAPGSAAAIATDLSGEKTTSLRIAHVIVKGSIRGIDVRNPGANGAGRTIIIDLDDNEMTGNTFGNGQGIRFVNANGANGASISASLHGNRSHGNLRGCLVANLNSSGSSIVIDSHDDRFENNNIGCAVYGGDAQTASSANDNSVTFTIHLDLVENNTGFVQPDNQSGGFVIIGGRGDQAGSASRNTVRFSTWGAKFEFNQDADISASGGRTSASAPVGTDNVVYINLNGSSDKAIVDSTASEPAEIGGTNRVIISN
jgi:hypothetical protein